MPDQRQHADQVAAATGRDQLESPASEGPVPGVDPPRPDERRGPRSLGERIPLSGDRLDAVADLDRDLHTRI